MWALQETTCKGLASQLSAESAASLVLCTHSCPHSHQRGPGPLICLYLVLEARPALTLSQPPPQSLVQALEPKCLRHVVSQAPEGLPCGTLPCLIPQCGPSFFTAWPARQTWWWCHQSRAMALRFC